MCVCVVCAFVQQEDEEKMLAAMSADERKKYKLKKKKVGMDPDVGTTPDAVKCIELIMTRAMQC